MLLYDAFMMSSTNEVSGAFFPVSIAIKM